MRERTLVCLIAGSVTCVFLIDFCALIYQCGCRSLWAGADAHCNVHMAGVRHCPWCAIGTAGFGAVTLVILGTQAMVSFGSWNPGWLARLGAAVAAFPVVGALLAGALGLWHRYW